jgi:SprT protein
MRNGRTRQELPRNGELEHQAAEHTLRLLGVAAGHFRAKIAVPSIRFDLRGKAAGQVRIVRDRTCLVRYNAALLIRHPSAFLAQTVPHETAHVVVFHVHGPRGRPHGGEWQSVMRLFGAVPERCHSFEVDGLQTRRLRHYDYHCGCRAHQLSSIRHNRVQAGQLYLCRRCGQALQPVSKGGVLTGYPGAGERAKGR